MPDTPGRNVHVEEEVAPEEKHSGEQVEDAAASAKAKAIEAEVLVSENVADEAASVAAKEVLMAEPFAGTCLEREKDTAAASTVEGLERPDVEMTDINLSLDEHCEGVLKNQEEAPHGGPIEKLLLGAPSTQLKKLPPAGGKKILDLVNYSQGTQQLVEAVEVLEKQAATVVKLTKVSLVLFVYLLYLKVGIDALLSVCFVLYTGLEFESR